jgi:hypothetical protein
LPVNATNNNNNKKLTSEDGTTCDYCGNPIESCMCVCPFCGEVEDCECCLFDAATGGG